MRAALLAIFGFGLAAGVAEEPFPTDADRLRQIFSNADKNGDGVITIAEFKRPRLFRQVDTNGDGRITAQEANAALEARRGAKTSRATAASNVARSEGRTYYQSHLNIPYAEIPGVDPNLLSLDIYSPVPPVKGGAPVVIMVHGGGWRAGDKANRALGPEKAAFFTSQGYVYISVNYRLSPAVKHPAHAEDVARAVVWVAKHIKTYGGNPGKISLMGHSAGAHLAALVATNPRFLTALGEFPTLVKNVILLDTAGYDIKRNMEELSEGRLNRALYENAFGKDPGAWPDASPITHVQSSRDLPRYLIFYTDRKSSGPISRDFAAAIRKTGRPATAVLAWGKTHSTLNQDIGKSDDGPSRLILEFLGGADSFPDSL
jgi:arylformamidase